MRCRRRPRGYRTVRVGVAACATGRQVVLEPVAMAAAAAPAKAAPTTAVMPKLKAVTGVQAARKADYDDQEARMKAWFDARKAAQANGSR